MIDNTILILFGMAILGMLGAFFLGTWKSRERMFESSKKYEIESPDDFEVTEEEYEDSLKAWKQYGSSEQNTG